MLADIFNHRSLFLALSSGFVVEPSKWPVKDKYPAVASKKTQVVTYGLPHFMVRLSFHGLYELFCLCTTRVCGLIAYAVAPTFPPYDLSSFFFSRFSVSFSLHPSSGISGHVQNEFRGFRGRRRRSTRTRRPIERQRNSYSHLQSRLRSSF
jgi:hypothetical protein